VARMQRISLQLSAPAKPQATNQLINKSMDGPTPVHSGQLGEK
jgi:hypothetical protein